jgi:hypothetical protein
MWETNMASSADRFWKAVGRWRSDQSEIVVELESMGAAFLAETFRGTVARVREFEIFFLTAKGERSIDFAGAEIRSVGCERSELAEVVCRFRIAWSDDEEPGTVLATLTELRKPVAGVN